MIYDISYDEQLILIHKDLTRDRFLDAAGVTVGSHSASLFERIYDYFFSESMDSRYEYERYHYWEYRSFKEFLFKKYNLSFEIMETIVPIITENSDLRIYRSSKSSEGYSGLGQFLDSEILYPRIEKLMQMNPINIKGNED